jgi:hypothetical protein
MGRTCSKCKLPIGAREGWTRVEGQAIHRTCQKGIVAKFYIRLKTDLVVNGQVLAPAGVTLDAYRSPGYLAKRASWLVLAANKVVEVFSEDIELITVQSVDEKTVPDIFKRYTVPDHRGFTTMPYQRE